MLRQTGSLMLAAACAMYGAELAAALRRRRDFMREFVTSLSVIETEIIFCARPLGEIFKKLDNKKLYGLFTECAAEIDKCGIKAAWEAAARQAAQCADLPKSCVDTLMQIGSELGRSDKEGQKKAIKRTAALADAAAAEADEEYKRMGRVYRGCGLLAGALCIIAFI